MNEKPLMNEFYVGGYRVDMSRSQIVAQEHIMSMEPKVLQVLLILAKNQGQVVTHDEILSQVWPDVIVAPNALQRCIAQLRKAFGDDAKTQKVIATHPKVGYSLLADVDWQEAIDKADVSDVKPQTPAASTQWPQWAAAGVLIVVLLMSLMLFNGNEKSLPLTRLTALTTTDNKEFYPMFSPDGRYIAFSRFISTCKSQIWVKDLAQDTEYRLTRDAGVYGPPAWSPDGRQLAFSHVTQCSEQQMRSGCASIHGLSFGLSKAKPQPTRELLACDEYSYGGVNWLSNEQLVFKAIKEESGEVRRLTLSDGKVDPYFSQAGFKPYALSYSPALKTLSVTGFDQSQNAQWFLIDDEDGSARKVQMQIPEDYAAINNWDPVWHPTEASLLVSVGSSLFNISTDGVFSEFPVPTMHDIYTPVYHPDGKRIAATMGTLDTDVGEYQGVLEAGLKAAKSIKNRSIVEEYMAQYQPQGQGIAFISKRSGRDQIWFEQAGQSQQLTRFAKGELLEGYTWSYDGRYLVAIVNGALQLINLDGEQQQIRTEFKAIRLFHWLNEKELLLTINEDKTYRTIKFDIQTGRYDTVYEGFSMWAQLDGDALYFLDYGERIKVFKAGQTTVFKATEALPVWSQFYVRNGQLYLVDGAMRMWQVDLQSGVKRQLEVAHTGEDSWRMNDLDIANDRMLFTTVHEARKEIVLFE